MGMTDKKTVIQALAYGFGNGVCKDHEFRFADMPEPYNIQKLIGDALEILIAQEPHIITKKDFENNPNVDEDGYLPAYCERIDRPIGWMAIRKSYIGARKDIRYWTGKPTDEQREAEKWEWAKMEG